MYAKGSMASSHGLQTNTIQQHAVYIKHYTHNNKGKPVRVTETRTAGSMHSNIRITEVATTSNICLKLLLFTCVVTTRCNVSSQANIKTQEKLQLRRVFSAQSITSQTNNSNSFSPETIRAFRSLEVFIPKQNTPHPMNYTLNTV